MSSKAAAAEARESFLRRLEQQQQQQQQQKQQQQDDGKEDNEMGKKESVTNDNAPQLKATGEKDAAEDTTTKKQSSDDEHTTPAKDEKLPPPSTAKEVPALETPPSQSSKEETLVLKSIVKSCGLSHLDELNNIDPSSLQLLRTLSTPRIKRRLESGGAKSTSGKTTVGKKKDGEVIPRSLDFGPASSQTQKEGETTKKPPPINEIALDQTITFHRQTSDLTAFNYPKVDNSSSPNNDDDSSEDDIFQEEEEEEEDVNTEATTAGSKQEIDLIRQQQRRSKRHLMMEQSKSTKTITTSNKSSNIDVESLEPWQQQLFEMLQKQQEQMEIMNGRIEELTNALHSQQTFRGQNQQQQSRGWEQSYEHESYRPNEYPFQYSSSDNQPQQQQDRAIPQETQTTTPPANLPPQRPYPQPQPPHFIVLPFITKIFTILFSIPKKLYTYLSTTRIIRILKAFYHEAQTRNDVHANLDINLLFKLLFVCFIFGGRVSSSSSSYKKDKDGSSSSKSMAQILDYYRIYIFVGVGIVVYLIQTGIAGLFWEFFVKGDAVRKIWNNEDLMEDHGEEEKGGGENNGQGEEVDGNNNHNNQAQRRGQQQDGNPPNDNNNNHRAVGAVGAEEGGGGGVVARRRRVRTIADGGIRRRPQAAVNGENNEHVAVSFLHDVKYLVGGFILSLLPTWRPELVEDEEEQTEESGGNDVAPAAVDGGNGGQDGGN